jgi:hypothetical protein
MGLPCAAPVRLVGRERTWAQLQRLLAGAPPKHVQITGAAGIGKTALVQEAVRQQIDAGQIGHLIWVARPRSVQEVLACAQTALPCALSLREYSGLLPVALVLDGIERLGAEATGLERLLDELGMVLVYLTSRVRAETPDCPHRVATGPSDAVDLVERWSAHALVDGYQTTKCRRSGASG